MKNICFPDSELFSNEDQMAAGNDNWDFIYKEGDEDEHWLAELDFFNHFPSFNNLSFDGMIENRFGNDSELRSIHFGFEKPAQSIHADLLNQDASQLALQKSAAIKLSWDPTFNFQNQKHWIFDGDDKGETAYIEQKDELKGRIVSDWKTWKFPTQNLKIDDLLIEIINQIKNPTINRISDLNSVSKGSIKEEEKEMPTQANNSSLDPLNSSLDLDQINSKWFKRWGKEKDKKAFDTLKKLCQINGISINQFLNVDESEVIDEFSQIFTNELYSNIIQSIADQYMWIRKPIYLFYRFKKIYSSEDKLSFREVKLLKRLLIQSNSDPIDIESIMYHFPGKSISVIKATARNIMQNI